MLQKCIVNAILANLYSERYTVVKGVTGESLYVREVREKLRKARTAKKATLEDLAEAIGSSKAYVWQLENKKSAKPSADLLLKIANFLAVSPDFLLDDDREEQTEAQLDDAFFRTFRRLSESDKRYIHRIMTGLDDKPE